MCRRVTTDVQVTMVNGTGTTDAVVDAVATVRSARECDQLCHVGRDDGQLPMNRHS